MTSDLVSHESMILEKFWDSDLSVLIPRPLYSGTWAKGHQILITEALQLQPLPRDAGCAHIAAWDVASSGGTVNSVLRESAYWHNAVGRVSCGDDGENQNTEPLLKVLDEIKRLWGDREFDFGISHGDWTRSNVGIVDGRVAGLDWERCVDLAPCGIDIAHFTLSEETTRSFSRSVDLERVLPKLQHYLKTANSSAENAQPLITLALLEMVIRFRSARNAGLKSFDSKFEVALQAALQKWKV